jgi:hypothetical protein
LEFWTEAPAGRLRQKSKIASPTNNMRLSEGAAFILPSHGWLGKRPVPALSFADAWREQMGFLRNRGGAPMGRSPSPMPSSYADYLEAHVKIDKLWSIFQAIDDFAPPTE